VTAFQHAHAQTAYPIRLEWGRTGAAAITADCDVAVVVDTLSFTTTLTVAADRDVVVFPYQWRDSRAEAFAVEREATLAVGRSEAAAGQVSLSADTIRHASGLRRLVLPSPNGSSISFELARQVPVVIGVSLRNRRVAAQWLLSRHEENPAIRVAVIAAGEQWPDGSLRPAAEDLWGAGALLDVLSRTGWSGFSPEASLAVAAFRSVAANVGAALADCASGRELIAMGYRNDVTTASEIDSSSSIPLLREDAFVPA
jgi:2-phosphosulfolactate phosphatase